jgi:adenine/guanine phosphoribosyltransferase-like PRPP-binding protein
MLMVRKKSRGDHASRMVEGDRAAKKYLIVDDFRSTGYTTKEIIKKVKQFAPDAECVGAYFYNTDRFESDVDLLKKERT